MSLAAAIWAGYVLAHPAWLATAACVAAAVVFLAVIRAENRRDDRDDGIPKAPRRGTRSRARGTRRQATVRACRRAGTTLAGGTSWGRRAIALRVRGITIDVTGDAEPYEPTEAEEAYMAEHHPAALLTVGPPGRLETPANAPQHPRTPPNGGEEERDWGAWGGRAPCCCERANSADDATTAGMDCPRHGNPGYGPENFIPPTRLATGAERAEAALWYAPELAPRAGPSPWEHQTQWFSLDAIDADIRAREAAAAGGDA